MYCVPDPIRPPSPTLYTSFNGPSSPPAGDSTSPVRSITTRAPPSTAARVAASQSRVTLARKPVPGGADSSITVPPASP